MSRRALPLALAAVLLAPLSAAQAAPRSHALAGTVRISTSTSAAMIVRLPKPASFNSPFIAPAGTSLKGDGRVVGVTMYDVKMRAPSYDVIRFNHCDTPGCSGNLGSLFFHAHDAQGDGHAPTLPAGDYRLVVVTDGKPVDIVMKFPGLSGSVTLHPAGRVTVKSLTPEYESPVDKAAPFGTAYTGYADYGVDGGDAMALLQFQVRTDMSVQQNQTWCIYPARVDAPPGPQCPDGSTTQFGITDVKQEPGYWRSSLVARFFPEGTYRAGAWYNALGMAHDPTGTVTWVVVPRT
jgi:hypothetical protein